MATRSGTGTTTSPSEQSERFVEAAREVGTDDDPERFKETIRKLAKAPPAPGPSKAGKAKATRPKR
jgi:hypothetical protein